MTPSRQAPERSEPLWQRGVFAMKGAGGGEWTVSGEFIYGKWGISKRDGDEPGRKLWNLTHLPTGFCVFYTTEKSDAKLAAKICDEIKDFAKIDSIETAAPYTAAVKHAFEAAGLHHHGGSRFERWEIANDDLHAG